MEKSRRATAAAQAAQKSPGRARCAPACRAIVIARGGRTGPNASARTASGDDSRSTARKGRPPRLARRLEMRPIPPNNGRHDRAVRRGGEGRPREQAEPPRRGRCEGVCPIPVARTNPPLCPPSSGGGQPSSRRSAAIRPAPQDRKIAGVGAVPAAAAAARGRQACEKAWVAGRPSCGKGAAKERLSRQRPGNGWRRECERKVGCSARSACPRRSIAARSAAVNIKLVKRSQA